MFGLKQSNTEFSAVLFCFICLSFFFFVFLFSFFFFYHDCIPCDSACINEPRHEKNQQNECAPSEDSDQTVYPLSLIRVFAMRSMGR